MKRDEPVGRIHDLANRVPPHLPALERALGQVGGGNIGRMSSRHLDDWVHGAYDCAVDIEPGARKHDVSDDDMMHAIRNHWRAFETDDPDVTMFIGPSINASPLEIGVVTDDDGTAVIHAMPARNKFLKGWWKP